MFDITASFFVEFTREVTDTQMPLVAPVILPEMYKILTMAEVRAARGAATSRLGALHVHCSDQTDRDPSLGELGCALRYESGELPRPSHVVPLASCALYLVPLTPLTSH